jgi:hypothetical protein
MLAEADVFPLLVSSDHSTARHAESRAMITVAAEGERTHATESRKIEGLF